MREFRSLGSVRGAVRKDGPYRDELLDFEWLGLQQWRGMP